jgi:hypothetical protein
MEWLAEHQGDWVYLRSGPELQVEKDFESGKEIARIFCRLAVRQRTADGTDTRSTP